MKLGNIWWTIQISISERLITLIPPLQPSIPLPNTTHNHQHPPSTPLPNTTHNHPHPSQTQIVGIIDRLRVVQFSYNYFFQEYIFIKMPGKSMKGTTNLLTLIHLILVIHPPHLQFKWSVFLKDIFLSCYRAFPPCPIRGYFPCHTREISPVLLEDIFPHLTRDISPVLLEDISPVILGIYPLSC